MLKRIASLALAVLLACVVMLGAAAQDLPYFFQVSREEVHVYWNADGSQSLDYTWEFVNQPGAHPIDFVDVGMPNSNFESGSIAADVDGKGVAISTDYQGEGSGFAVVMEEFSIPAGGSGRLHVHVGRVTGVLYPDDQDEAYASAVFMPSFFGAQNVTGKTDLTMVFHLPPGIQPEEPRWHEAPAGFPAEPERFYDEENRVSYSWHASNANASDTYTFGASFPRSYVPAESIIVPAAEPWINEDTIFTLCCGGIFLLVFVVSPALVAINSKKRKMQYMPPKVSIEGNGIKRGLTAVEAAILMGEPLDKILTMILFGVIKKQAASVIKREPLELEIDETLPETLQVYEKDFLAALKNKESRERQNALEEMMVKLVKSVSEKMRGFSRQETVDYYKAIMEKAWEQIEAAGTPDMKSQKMDEGLEWTMLERDYDGRARRVFTGPVFLPGWWGSYDPRYGRGTGGLPTSSSTSSSQSKGGQGSGLPGADFAAQMVTGVQTFSQKTIGNINTFTEKITGKTNPAPPPSSSRGGGRSSGGGGGHSCACACACAGCACACAGGGR